MVASLEGYLSPAQAARRLGVADSTLRWLVKTGKLPATKTPIGFIVHCDDLDDLATKRAAKAATLQIPEVSMT